MDFEKLILKGKARVAIKKALVGSITHRDLKVIIAYQTYDVNSQSDRPIDEIIQRYKLDIELEKMGKGIKEFIYELRCITCN